MLAATSVTDANGRYSAQVPAGTYRIMFNEIDDGTTNWSRWRPTPWRGVANDLVVKEFSVGPDADTSNLYPGYLIFRGGTMTGTVKTTAGSAAGKVSVYVYDASDPRRSPVTGERVQADGTYSIPVPLYPVKIRIYSGSPNVVDEWLDDAATFNDAKTFDLGDGEISANNDANLTYVPSADVSGRVTDEDGRPVPDARVTIYKLMSGTEPRYDHYALTFTSAQDADAGTFSRTLEPGTYKVRVTSPGNQERLLRSSYYGDATYEKDAMPVFQVGNHQTLPDIVLKFTGGLVTGRVTDIFGKPVPGVQVSSGAETGGQLDSTVTATDGTYNLRGSDGQVRLFFSARPAHLLATDLGGLTTPIGETVTAPDVVMKPMPIVVTSRPRITGKVKVGSTLKGSGGGFSRPVTKTYRWMQVKGGRTTPVPGATKSSYTLKKSDYGKSFRFQVTASYPTVPSKSVMSGTTAVLRHASSVSVSGSSPSQWKVKLSAKVKVADGVKPRGTVTFSCGNLDSRRVTVKNGKASATLSVLWSGKISCTARYGGTATIDGSSKSKTVKVKG